MFVGCTLTPAVIANMLIIFFRSGPYQNNEVQSVELPSSQDNESQSPQDGELQSVELSPSQDNDNIEPSPSQDEWQFVQDIHNVSNELCDDEVCFVSLFVSLLRPILKIVQNAVLFPGISILFF